MLKSKCACPYCLKGDKKLINYSTSIDSNSNTLSDDFKNEMRMNYQSISACLNFYEKDRPQGDSNISLDNLNNGLEPYDFETGNIYNNIAFLKSNKGQFEQALEYYYESINIFENTLGPLNPYTAIVYSNLGVNYIRTKDLKNAELFLFLAKDIFEKKTLCDNYRKYLAFLYNNLSIFFKEIKDYVKAYEFTEKSYEILIYVLGKDQLIKHRETIICLDNLQSISQLMGINEIEIKENTNLSEIYENLCGKDNLTVANLHRNQAIIALLQNNYEKAQNHAELSLKAFQSVHQNSIDLAECNSILSIIHECKGDNKRSQNYSLITIKTIKNLKDYNNMNLVNTLMEKAKIFLKMEKYDNALKEYNYAISMLEKCEKKELEVKIDLYYAIAFIYLKKKDVDKALANLKLCHDEGKRFLGEEHPQTIKSFEKVKLLDPDFKN